MKIAQSLRAFLLSNQYLELPTIGKFELFFQEPADGSGNGKKQYIRFSRNNNPEPDPAFINFLCQNFRVDPYVASSDLNTFCASVRELLLQGFEAEIPQIGYVRRDANHELVFSTTSKYKTISKIYRKKIAPVFKSSFWL